MTQAIPNMPDQSAIDAVNLSRIRAAQDEFNSQNGSLRSTFAKAEMQGLHLAAAKRALKVIKSGKQDEMISEFSKTVEYLRLLGNQVEFGSDQLDLFKAGGPAPEDEKARNEGQAAGRIGKPESDNPYDIGSIKGQAWLTAYRDGASERALVLSMKVPEDDEPEYGEGDDDDGED